ncbi:hypothetical protein FHL15_006461 [Xylaria flabelliformis]|uniref:Uncharacterized protein n=1 Tax=Xylaria flabelliformis TaxID=2512241 RepID=A0A553HX60_9PEZI|nr:hypothetical protein FHL15_006461 [Xylaria flabelliformis]
MPNEASALDPIRLSGDLTASYLTPNSKNLSNTFSARQCVNISHDQSAEAQAGTQHILDAAEEWIERPEREANATQLGSALPGITLEDYRLTELLLSSSLKLLLHTSRALGKEIEQIQAECPDPGRITVSEHDMIGEASRGEGCNKDTELATTGHPALHSVLSNTLSSTQFRDDASDMETTCTAIESVFDSNSMGDKDKDEYDDENRLGCKVPRDSARSK